MKKNYMIFLAILVAVMAVSVLITAQIRKQPEPIPSNVVSEAMRTFTQLVNESNVKDFGLESVAQLKSLKPGKEYNKYMIGLDDVKKYKAGDDVEKMIKEFPSVEITLVDGNAKIITSIEFEKTDGKWKATGFGPTPAVTSLKTVQLSDSAAREGRLIRIPALHTSFIAVPSATGLNFIPTKNEESLNFRAGMMMPASEAISRLTTVANQYNGLPQ